jgi:LPS-assembly protein
MAKLFNNILIAGLAMLLNTTALYAAEEKAEEVFMQSDDMAYDNKNAIVIARGSVEVVRGERILLADKIYYYQKQDIVKADGNIRLLQPDGSILFADNLILEDEFKRGVVEKFKARFADNSAFAAAQAKRLNENELELTNAVYSPCKICQNDPDFEPLWQLKSDKVMVDNVKERVDYEDVTLEVKGLPVFYSPYFSHPTPDAKRKSGLLRPQHSNSTNLGFNAQYPYYINIAPDKDATITPWFTSEEGMVGLGEYRQIFDDGYINLFGSITNPSRRNELTGEVIGGREIRGHLFSRGEGGINEDWRWGFNVQRTTDDTYLRRYQFGFFETLPSRVYVENVDERNYMLVESMTFQRLDGQVLEANEPYILPNAELHLSSEPMWHNARASIDASSFTLMRREGTDVRRLSTAANLMLPHVTDGGHVFNAEGGVRTDLYNSSDVIEAGRLTDATVARVIPHAALKWRYPLMTQIADHNVVVEPIAKIIATTNNHNKDGISNQDSLTPEFNALNLFRSNRYAGLDLIEEGTRTMAGIQSSLNLDNGDAINAMLGQELRLSGDNPFPVSGVNRNDTSDIVGQLGYNGSNLSLEALYRVDDEDYLLRRSEIRGQYSLMGSSIGVDHVFIDDDAILANRNDLTLYAGTTLYQDFSVSAFARRDLLRDAMVMAGGSFAWTYDCIVLQTNFAKAFTSDRDFQEDTSITFLIGLKNLSY